MRIIIDMQGAQTTASAHRGVGRYTINLVRELLRFNNKNDIYLVLNGAYPESIVKIREIFSKFIDQSKILVWRQMFNFAGLDINMRMQMLASEFVRESFINNINPDLVFSTNLQEGMLEPAPTSVKKYFDNHIAVSTLHDVIPLMNNEQYFKIKEVKKWYFDKINAVKNSDLILTVSESSKSEIIKILNIRSEKIKVISNGVDTSKFKKIYLSDYEISKLQSHFLLPRNYIVYFGGCDEHKDLGTLFKSFSLLKKEVRSKFKLVLIGKEIKLNTFKISATLKKLRILDDVHMVGEVADEDLVKILNLSKLCVFPSLFEGFSLPPLEAMACGLPVLVSSAPAHAELVANNQMIFKTGDSIELSLLINKVLTNGKFSSELISYGLTRAKNYTWENSAKKLLSIIDSIEIPKKNLAAEKDKSAFRRVAKDFDDLQYDNDFLLKFAYAIDINLKIREKKCLYLDVSAIIVNGDHTGIQRTVRAIASELLNNNLFDIDVRLVYTSTESLCHYYASDIEKKWLWGKSPVDISSKKNSSTPIFLNGDILLYLDLHPAVTISHAPRNEYLKSIGVKVYHVVYDMLPISNKHFFTVSLCHGFECWLNSIFHSTGAVCISKTVATELKNWVKLNSKPDSFEIKWFHLGADISKSIPTLGYPDNSITTLAKIKSSQSFLMVGTLEPRKGHAQVLDAFEFLWERGEQINLVLVGKKGWLIEELILRLRNHPQLNKKLFWLEAISDEYLENIYESSSCLIAASYAEGFGLPLIEATRHKLPIICRDIPVFREVAGEHAYYFKASNGDELAHSIQQWLSKYKINIHPKSNHMPWLTWKQSSDQLLSILGIELSKAFKTK